MKGGRERRGGKGRIKRGKEGRRERKRVKKLLSNVIWQVQTSPLPLHPIC